MSQTSKKLLLQRLRQKLQALGFVPSDDFLDYETPTLCSLCQKVECICTNLNCICDFEASKCIWPNGPRCYCLQCENLTKECKCKTS